MDIWVGLAGVIVGALLAPLIDLWRESRGRKRRASYLAIRVVCILDRFVEGCVDVSYDNGGERDRDGYVSPQTPHPTLTKYSDDIDWSSISSTMAFELLSLPNQIEAANQSIQYVADHDANPPDYEEVFEARQEQFSILGLEAIRLTRILRQQFSLPKTNHISYDPFRVLCEKKESIEKTRDRSTERLMP